ncbi:uncharacterized protein EI90DRAFT_3191385, partial [Cantharellus anzutake]|uniref:uncharacterized protein n=1 Tax=Cantharellus anzutake TaxID=1750568 RepID=UPI0019083DF4
ATKDPGSIAGLDVRRILSEPTAAAIAYGFKISSHRVPPIGRRYIDMSLLSIESTLEVIAVLVMHIFATMGLSPKKARTGKGSCKLRRVSNHTKRLNCRQK